MTRAPRETETAGHAADVDEAEVSVKRDRNLDDETLLVFPAEPGYRAMWTHQGCAPSLEPIVAWELVSLADPGLKAIEARPVTPRSWGMRLPDAVVLPDGRVLVMDGRGFDTVEEAIEAVGGKR